jgi:hypothetical protein
VWETCSGEQRDLLTTSYRIHDINCRYASLNHFFRVCPFTGIDRTSCTRLTKQYQNLGVLKSSAHLKKKLLPEISRYASGKIGGPLSIGFPEPLKMRPSISRDTGVLRTLKNANKRNMNEPKFCTNMFLKIYH